MEFNDLADPYNAFIDGKNETRSSDVLNDEYLIDSENTVNAVGHDVNRDDGDDWNNSEREDGDKEQAVDLSLDGEENLPVIITNVNDLKPTIGMVFSTDDEAYQHYNSYAKEIGFSIRKYRVDRSKLDKHVVARYYVCSNQGEKIKDKRRKVDYQQHVTKKTHCGALLMIKSSNGVWVVDKFEKEHNHILVNRNESFRLRSHQKRHKSTVDLVQRLHKCGIRQAHIMRVVKDFAGGEKFAGINDEFSMTILWAN
ncbi:protein FAR1-RELATED SEQUENCE 5-like [Telopea speciosissima]|uniref:protein FAR1-RELATED SEQUENCE 5-like n=1 Tax=Telopea speciosissima TaxID=54955 RepID=UPI001CC7FB5A|nr:protein FAR1-RELATED SEQUENCE 5-like [Telopea speciosissima]